MDIDGNLIYCEIDPLTGAGGVRFDVKLEGGRRQIVHWFCGEEDPDKALVVYDTTPPDTITPDMPEEER